MADDVNVTPAQTMRLAGQRASATTENLRELSVTLIDLAQANIQTAFDFARQATAVTTPADMVKLWAEHVPKQLELLCANEAIDRTRATDGDQSRVFGGSPKMTIATAKNSKTS